MKVFVFFAVLACVYAAEETKKEDAADPALNKDKRQTQEDTAQTHYVYRSARKQQEQVAPVEESQEEDRVASASNQEQYRPGQVISLTGQELLELQQERKAPALVSAAQLQHLQQYYQQEKSQQYQQEKQGQQFYQQEKQGLVPQFYYVDPQQARQPASHTVIVRPSSSVNGGEASVGAALSVSDSGANHNAVTSFDDELLAFLGQGQDSKTAAYLTQAPAQPVASVAPQYQQIDRYITKVQPTKKPQSPKLRAKVHVNPPQSATAPQQYLIETTNNVQQHVKLPQPQLNAQPQYRFLHPQPQAKPTQTLRYVTIPQPQAIQPTSSVPQFAFYSQPETHQLQGHQNQGLKVVAAPKLQQPRTQLTYRFVPQYVSQPQQQPIQEVAQKQFRYIEARPQATAVPQQAHKEQARIPASSIDRPVTYLKRYPESEKPRTVKIYDQNYPEGLTVVQRPQHQQFANDQYYLRSLAQRPSEPRQPQLRYEIPQYSLNMEKFVEQLAEQQTSKPPHSSIYVSKNLVPKKVAHQHSVRIEEQVEGTQQPQRAHQGEKVEHVNLEQHGQSLDERRAQLPPPKNNKAYTPEEFAALVAAGYSVTPVPVGSLGSQAAQSRSSLESVQVPQQRQPLRRHQYYPLIRSEEGDRP
ncbi:hypothetical protein JYU34_005231 [Plutella xylostella]|uniref:Cuticular protein n=1 Tax=Plutella xylostella TaxID=51655 RepID=A0ABQ7QW71_PLUXY|nr:hypothetical protein JYU34_005231 [Plutella xylostella]